MSAQLKEIQKTLAAKSDRGNVAFVNKIVPGSGQKVYGVKTPDLNLLARKYRPGAFELAEELWTSGAHEERIIAIKIVEKTGRSDPQRVLKLLKKYSKTIDNWAICDGLGMQFIRSIVKTHRDEIFALAYEFSRSKNQWQRRLALVMVEWYTRHSDNHADIRKLVRLLENDEEYYVKKALAWVNRNLAKEK